MEELRIGSLEGGDASFGSIVGLAVLQNGDIRVGDAMAAEIRRFADGTFLGVVASKGEGPGELEGIPGPKRLPDGRVVVWDARGCPITVTPTVLPSGIPRRRVGADGRFPRLFRCSPWHIACSLV